MPRANESVKSNVIRVGEKERIAVLRLLEDKELMERHLLKPDARQTLLNLHEKWAVQNKA